MALKIMVVDDDPGILNLIKDMVEPMGCEVLGITDSRHAADLIQHRKFDGIFVDAQMPYLDGFQLTKHIRNSPSNYRVPVVMITGYDDAATMRQGFGAGISMFLGKPITHERLIRLMNVLRGAMIREKRRYTRLVYRDPVVCTRRSRGHSVAQASGLDLSEGGMALIQALDMEVGDAVTLEFDLPGAQDAVNLAGHVVRKLAPDGIAVQFGELTPATRQALQMFVKAAVI